MWNWISDNWMAMLSLAIAVFAFFRAGRADRRSRRTFDERHAVVWEARLVPPSADRRYAEIRFTNVSDFGWARHAWCPPENFALSNPNRFIYLPYADNVAPSQFMPAYLQNLEQVVRLPDWLIIRWIPKMSVFETLRWRLRDLTSDYEDLPDGQSVSLEEVKRQARLDMRKNASAPNPNASRGA